MKYGNAPGGVHYKEGTITQFIKVRRVVHDAAQLGSL